jgi:hypothetical protein
LYSILQAILNHYDEVKRKHAEKQQVYLETNRDSLTNIHDKSLFEMKPCATLTGKEQPPLRKGMSK